MNLYNSINKIIRLFEKKAISLSIFAYDAKSDGVKESEQKRKTEKTKSRQ